MKVLFDQGTPLPLRNRLKNHQIHTAQELGWASLKNGDLLAKAEAEQFEVMVTTDKNLRYQQNLCRSQDRKSGAGQHQLASHREGGRVNT